MIFFMIKKKVLSIDDDPIIQRLFGGWLAHAGYDAVYAHDGESGRDMARKYKPDLILIDINMPGNEDGFQTALRLREEEETKHIPISLLSSNDLSLEVEKHIKEMGVHYMHKGVESEQFIKNIKLFIKEKL